MKQIEVNHKNDVSRCLQECLSAWLHMKDDVESKGGPTWISLKDALKKLDENAVANGIEKDCKTLTVIYNIYNFLQILKIWSQAFQNLINKLLLVQNIPVGRYLSHIMCHVSHVINLHI